MGFCERRGAHQVKETVKAKTNQSGKKKADRESLDFHGFGLYQTGSVHSKCTSSLQEMTGADEDGLLEGQD